MPVAGSCQFVEQRLRLFQIGGVEAFGEPAVDRREKVAGFGARGPGCGTGGRGSQRRAIPRAWPPAPRRCSGLCDTVPRRPRYAPAAAAAGLCACSAPLRTSAPLSFRRSAEHRPTGSRPLQFALRSHMPWLGGRYDRASTPPPRWRGKRLKPLRRSDIPSATSPFLTLTQPRKIVPSARQKGKPCSVATATSWSARSSRAALSPTSESSLAPKAKLEPKTADEPASEPRRLPRCSVPMPGPESRDRKGQSPRSPVSLRGGGIRPDGQASGGRLDHKAQAPLPDAIGMTRTCRQTSGFDRSE